MVEINLDIPRQALSDLMVDSCTISRSTGVETLNTTTGAVTEEPAEIVYSGQCKFRYEQSVGNSQNLVGEGGRFIVLERFTIAIPWDAPLPAVNDIVMCDDSKHDPELIGRSFFVRSVNKGTYIVARKLLCEETSFDRTISAG